MALAVNSRERTTLESGFSELGGFDSDSAIRGANQELEQRAGSGLELALAILVEQRDHALRRAESARQQAERERTRVVSEQDTFISFLMADHEKQLAELQRELASAREDLARQRALDRTLTRLGALPPSSDPEVAESLRAAEAELAELQESLQAAYAEVDDTRSDAARLQEERDAAIRETNDIKFEFEKLLEAARDEASQVQWQLDEAQRRLLDASDQARDEACRQAEQLDELRRELDERNQEVRSLRARLASLDEEMQSRPPPAAAIELENARKEAQLLRKSLIEVKRDFSRLSAEVEAARARGAFPGEGKSGEREGPSRKR
jgi:chromosome segregation ATPase